MSGAWKELSGGKGGAGGGVRGGKGGGRGEGKRTGGEGVLKNNILEHGYGMVSYNRCDRWGRVHRMMPRRGIPETARWDSGLQLTREQIYSAIPSGIVDHPQVPDTHVPSSNTLYCRRPLPLQCRLSAILPVESLGNRWQSPVW